MSGQSIDLFQYFLKENLTHACSGPFLVVIINTLNARTGTFAIITQHKHKK